MTQHDLITYIGFTACVALATGIQNLTGFAFGLVLLGLLAMFDLVPVSDAANATTVLMLVNAASFFRLNKIRPEWRIIQPAILPSLMGVIAGVILANWLIGNADQWLRGLLAIAIFFCAVMMLLRAKPQEKISSRFAFIVAGWLSGLMGGLFSSAGPPMVHHMYRQPLPRELIQHCLVIIFTINQTMRLVLVVATGNFSEKSALLSLVAFPIIHIVAWLQKRCMPPINPMLLRLAVFSLLLLASVSILTPLLKTIT